MLWHTQANDCPHTIKQLSDSMLVALLYGPEDKELTCAFLYKIERT